MKTELLEIGQTYITESGDIRKLVKIEFGRCYFENLSKDVNDCWFYDGGGDVYSIAQWIIDKRMADGLMKIYKD